MQGRVETLVKAIEDVKQGGRNGVGGLSNEELLEAIQAKAKSWTQNGQSPRSTYHWDQGGLRVRDGQFTGRQQLARWVSLLLEQLQRPFVAIDDDENSFAFVAFDPHRHVVQLLWVIPEERKYLTMRKGELVINRLRAEPQMVIELCRELAQQVNGDNIEVWRILCVEYGAWLEYLGTLASVAAGQMKTTVKIKYDMQWNGVWTFSVQWGRLPGGNGQQQQQTPETQEEVQTKQEPPQAQANEPEQQPEATEQENDTIVEEDQPTAAGRAINEYNALVADLQVDREAWQLVGHDKLVSFVVKILRSLNYDVAEGDDTFGFFDFVVNQRDGRKLYCKVGLSCNLLYRRSEKSFWAWHHSLARKLYKVAWQVRKHINAEMCYVAFDEQSIVFWMPDDLGRVLRQKIDSMNDVEALFDDRSRLRIDDNGQWVAAR